MILYMYFHAVRNKYIRNKDNVIDMKETMANNILLLLISFTNNTMPKTKNIMRNKPYKIFSSFELTHSYRVTSICVKLIHFTTNQI